MKTKPEPNRSEHETSQIERDSSPQTSSEFHSLLQQPGRHTEANTASAAGIAIGQLQARNTDGSVQVDIDLLGLKNIKAMTLVDLSTHEIGTALALGFQNNNSQFPIVLGAIMQPQQNNASEAIDFDEPEEELEPEIDYAVIEAGKSLEIRCGKAVILLEADGTIQINGTYITSHASATHRILGGSVNIN